MQGRDGYEASSCKPKSTFNGNIYGANMANSPCFSPHVVYYNTDLIEKCGLKDPYEMHEDSEWTWDALWAMSKVFVNAARYEDRIGLSTMAGMEYQLTHNVPVITYDRENNKFSHNLQNTIFVESWQDYANKYDQGLVSQALTNNDAFDEGRLLFNVSTGIAARARSAQLI